MICKLISTCCNTTICPLRFRMLTGFHWPCVQEKHRCHAIVLNNNNNDNNKFNTSLKHIVYKVVCTFLCEFQLAGSFFTKVLMSTAMVCEECGTFSQRHTYMYNNPHPSLHTVENSTYILNLTLQWNLPEWPPLLSDHLTKIPIGSSVKLLLVKPLISDKLPRFQEVPL